MKLTRIVLWALSGFLLSATPVYAAVGPKFSFPVARAAHPLPLDPSLADAGWAPGKVSDGEGPWFDITTKAPAQESTSAYLLYDDRYLYVGFKAHQRPGTIVATQSTNDVGFGIDDFVGIGLSTTSSGAQGYYFETTPKGVRYQQADENVRYRPRWRAAAQTTADGWSAVLIVPLDVLKIAGSGNQTWRLQFVRALAGRAEHYVWSYDPLMGDAPGGNWPTFQDTRWWATGQLNLGAITRRKPSPRADVYGLAAMGLDRKLVQQANGSFLPETARPVGIDASIPLTPTISFVGTLNPDFSNVEIDQQTIVPQEFARQLVEYRPFFAQGANYINASSGSRSPTGPVTGPPNLIFYSPDIGPFDSGAKVEGTFGKQRFGALTFHGFDQVSGNSFSDKAYGYLHALPDASFLYWSDGVFANHSIDGYDNTAEVGTEARDLQHGLIAFADYAFENGSWVPQGHADSFEAFADIHKPHYEIFGGWYKVSPNYNPIDGFTANSDISGPMGFAQVNGSFKGVKNWGLFAAADRYIDYSGAVHQADTQIFLNATLANGFSINGAGAAIGQLREYNVPAGPGCSGPIVGQSFFTGYPCYVGGQTVPFNLSSIPIGYGDGTPTPIDVNYSWGPFGGNYVHLFNTAMSRPVARTISIGLAYDGTYERSMTTGLLDSQWLRSVSVGVNLTSESTFTVALRDINGYGGFATQIGNNLAVAYHQRFRTGNELYMNYGSPAAGAQLYRFIVKYVFHAGADAGT